jgi:hypothetical protein
MCIDTIKTVIELLKDRKICTVAEAKTALTTILGEIDSWDTDKDGFLDVEEIGKGVIDNIITNRMKK